MHGDGTTLPPTNNGDNNNQQTNPTPNEGQQTNNGILGDGNNQQTTPAPGSDTPWYSSMPETMHERLKDVSAEDAASALERGLKYQPVTDATSLQLEVPEQFPVAAETVDGFRQFAVEAGLTSEQAQAFVKYYAEQDAKGWHEAINTNKTALTEMWGQDYDNQVASAEKAVTFYDGKMGGRLKQAITNGLHSNAAFVELLSMVGKSISESDTASANGISTTKPMSSEEFYSQFHPKPE